LNLQIYIVNLLKGLPWEESENKANQKKKFLFLKIEKTYFMQKESMANNWVRITGYKCIVLIFCIEFNNYQQKLTKFPTGTRTHKAHTQTK